MEQNLSERERNFRLAIGILAGITASFLYLQNYDLKIVLALTAISVGFIINYFTCFCATKRLLRSLFSR